MTGKKKDSSTMTAEARANLETELAYHEDAARHLETRGNMDTYHHQRAAAIRALLNMEKEDDGELD